MLSRVFGFLILLLILACYPLAQVLPVSAGWENGLVENAQVVVLAGGAIMALFFSTRSQSKQWRWFWLMLVPLWLLLIGRELSWGASVLMPALRMHAETGPVYSSSQLDFRMQMHVIAGALLVLSALIFILTRQYRSIVQIVRKRSLPVFEIVLAVCAAILCTNAEGHGFMTFSALSEGQQQVLEELFELCVYLSVVAGQYRIGNKFGKMG